MNKIMGRCYYCRLDCFDFETLVITTIGLKRKIRRIFHLSCGMEAIKKYGIGGIDDK